MVEMAEQVVAGSKPQPVAPHGGARKQICFYFLAIK